MDAQQANRYTCKGKRRTKSYRTEMYLFISVLKKIQKKIYVLSHFLTTVILYRYGPRKTKEKPNGGRRA